MKTPEEVSEEVGKSEGEVGKSEGEMGRRAVLGMTAVLSAVVARVVAVLGKDDHFYTVILDTSTDSPLNNKTTQHAVDS